MHRSLECIVSRNDNRLEIGVYDIYCDGRYFYINIFRNAGMLLKLTIGPIQITNELGVHRIISHNVSGRDDSFRDGIRARDGKCVISSVVNRIAYE